MGAAHKATAVASTYPTMTALMAATTADLAAVRVPPANGAASSSAPPPKKARRLGPAIAKRIAELK